MPNDQETKQIWSFFNSLLGVGAQFYAIVPLLFIGIKRRSVSTLALALGSLAICMWAATISPKLAFFQMPLRLWEFLSGVMVAWMLHGRSIPASASPWAPCSAPIAILLVFFVPLQPESTHFAWGHPGMLALLVCLLTAAVIAFGMPQPMMDNRIGQALMVLGKYSYSIYLVHWPIIVLVNYLPFAGTRTGFSTLPQLAWILFLIAAASAAMFHFVEKRSGWVFVSWRPLYAILVLSGLAVVAVIGNDARFDDRQRRIFAAWTDRDTY